MLHTGVGKQESRNQCQNEKKDKKEIRKQKILVLEAKNRNTIYMKENHNLALLGTGPVHPGDNLQIKQFIICDIINTFYVHTSI